MKNVLALLVFLLPVLCYAQSGQSPNVIYILVDDLGYGDLSCYNTSGKIQTPHIDKLAQDGLRFIDAHSSSAVCTPTRYGILTGRYNWRSPLKRGVVLGYAPALIPSDRYTVADLFKSAGYSTACIGKWHLGWNWVKDAEGNVDFSGPVTGGPNDLGFDYSFALSASLDFRPYVWVRNGKATSDRIAYIERNEGYAFYRAGEIADDFEIEKTLETIFEEAGDYVDRKAASDRPFFLYLPLTAPHTPILPNDDWKGKSGLNPYGDFVMMIDHLIGDLMGNLDRLGIAENTMIVFMSDNGPAPMAGLEEMAQKGHSSSGGYRGHKFDVYEGGHRVPFIVNWPKGIKNHRALNQTVCSTDFMATMADLLDVSLPDNSAEDSFSLMPLIIGQGEFQRAYTITHSQNGQFAISMDNWKLVACAGSGSKSHPTNVEAQKRGYALVQLYNLAEDPAEQTNLYPLYKDQAMRLFDHLILCISQGRSTPGPQQQNDPEIKDGEWRQLKELQVLYRAVKDDEN